MYTPSKKNEIITRLADGDSFPLDSFMFVSIHPRHTLVREIARVNQYTLSRIHGQIINRLLDSFTEEDILANRSKETPSEILLGRYVVADNSSAAATSPKQVHPQKKSVKKKNSNT